MQPSSLTQYDHSPTLSHSLVDQAALITVTEDLQHTMEICTYANCHIYQRGLVLINIFYARAKF